MNINEKNKRFLNAVQSPQWKIVPKPDESDDVPVVQNPILQENRPVRQDFRHRLLRDATAFYRNDTSHFMGELQKAESLLHQKVNLISKIDFLPPKRKTTSSNDRQETQVQGFDELLSDTDSDIVTVQRIERKKHKNVEPEKLIVDVNDFIDTFSVVCEPVYHLVNKKKPADCDNKPEYDFLSSRVPLQQEIDTVGETPGHVIDLVEQLPPESIVVENVKPVNEPSVTCQDVLPCVDDPVTMNDAIRHQTHFAIGIVEDVYPCHPEMTQPISENNRELEIPDGLNGTKISEEQTVPETMELREHVHPHPCPQVTMNAVENQTGVAVSNNGHPSGDAADDTENETSTAFDAYLPGILERLGEFANDQCEDLANCIKDKVYDGSRLIAFCGMQRGAGCSTMTLLAARGIMRHGLKTAVIDANFESPKLNAMIGNHPGSEKSWINILHGADAWETFGITPKGMPLLTVFPLAENALVNWSRYEPEHLQQETNRFVSMLQEYFDLILLDCGCMENAFEEITWGELALFQPDGVILVRNPKKTPMEMLEPCYREIHNGGIGAFGVAENFV